MPLKRFPAEVAQILPYRQTLLLLNRGENPTFKSLAGTTIHADAERCPLPSHKIAYD